MLSLNKHQFRMIIFRATFESFRKGISLNIIRVANDDYRLSIGFEVGWARILKLNNEDLQLHNYKNNRKLINLLDSLILLLNNIYVYVLKIVSYKNVL